MGQIQRLIVGDGPYPPLLHRQCTKQDVNGPTILIGADPTPGPGMHQRSDRHELVGVARSKTWSLGHFVCGLP